MPHHGRPYSQKELSMHRSHPPKDKKAPKRWDKLTSLPFLALTTAVTVLVTWLTTQGLAVLERQRDLEDAVTISVQTNPQQVAPFSGEGVSVVMPPQTKVAPDPGEGCNDFHPTLTGAGGADADQTRLQVVVQGSATAAVLLSNLRAVVTKREQPLTGTVASCPSAGAAQIHSVRIDLDAQNAVAKLESSNDHFGFTIAEGETETFLVTAETQGCFCEWHLELEMVVAGHRQYREVWNGTQPFRTSASSDSTKLVEWDWSGSWSVWNDYGTDSAVEEGSVRPGEVWPDPGE